MFVMSSLIHFAASGHNNRQRRVCMPGNKTHFPVIFYTIEVCFGSLQRVVMWEGGGGGGWLTRIPRQDKLNCQQQLQDYSWLAMPVL